jgi:hypothetical protein
MNAPFSLAISSNAERVILLADSAASVCNSAAEILSFTELVSFFFVCFDELVSSVDLFL